MNKTAACVFALALLAFFAAAAFSEEGAWTFDNPPLQKIEQEYGVKLTAEWLDHFRLASVRLMDGGSGAFISGNGLVLTNHHVAAYCVQSLSTEQNDYMKNGYGVDAPAAEIQCPGSEADILMSTEEVSARVLGAVPAGAADAQAADARKAEIARIEKECNDATKLRCEVVNLYSGGQYWLYRYKKYQDVRLVFAPDVQTASFGGDPDNFNYPRFDLDFALLRVYENGKPLKTDAHLRCAENGFKDGDPIFISGNPSASERLQTLSKLQTMRDLVYPLSIQGLEKRLAVLKAYSQRSPESARRALLRIAEVENSLKVYRGYLDGLRNKTLMKKKTDEEEDLRRKAAADPKLSGKAGDAWGEIARVQEVYAQSYKPFYYTRMRGSDLYMIAQQIVELAHQMTLPNEKRFEEFRDSSLESLYHELYSPTPVHRDLEEVMLKNALESLRDGLGKDHPAVSAALGRQTPADVAKAAAEKTGLAKIEYRKTLVKGGEKAIRNSKDPMIRLALAVAPFHRSLRERYEKEVKGVEDGAGERIAWARFAIYGTQTYPDTTFTLRLAYGKVAGYEYAGYLYPPTTTIYGLYDRSTAFGNRPPFDLPKRWLDKKDSVRLSTPFNSVDTADTFPGNSGSPIVNAKGNLVGVLFDGNMPSLEIQYVYDEVSARSIAVNFDVIAESLRNVYGRPDLLAEIDPLTAP